jgi:hypothetical protein
MEKKARGGFSKTYTDRNFKGIMGLYHNRRFLWIKDELKSMGYSSILEIGCFNGRLLDFIKAEILFRP